MTTRDDAGALVAAFAAVVAASDEGLSVVLSRLTAEQRDQVIGLCERLSVAAYHLCRYCHQDIRGDGRAWSGTDTSAWHTGCQVLQERKR